MTQWTQARGRIDQLWARIHALGIRETLVIEREVFRRILKSTLAATLAWLAAELIDSPRPALASLAAIIVLQITVRASLMRSIQLTVAVTLGLGYGLERTVDTFVGAVIAVVVNALVAPPSHVSEASRTLRGIGEDLGALLTDLGTGLTKSPNSETIRRWLVRARDLAADSRAAIG